MFNRRSLRSLYDRTVGRRIRSVLNESISRPLANRAQEMHGYNYLIGRVGTDEMLSSAKIKYF